MFSRIMAEVLPTHTPELFKTAVRRATELLRAGEVVALPTETVYGLAANALNRDAVARIYEIKDRPSRNPIIVHVASIEMARRCVSIWPDAADQLAKSFWPGPLTLVLPRAVEASAEAGHSCRQDIASTLRIPDIVTAGGPTVGVRWPSHPFIQAVICECGFPIAAPSANLSSRISPTNAEHVNKSLGERIPLIVDGGQSQIGIESTVIDLSVSPPRVLRPGMIHAESLAAVCGEVSGPKYEVSGDESLRSPGLLQKHYAPRAKLMMLRWSDEADLRVQISSRRLAVSRGCVISHSRIPSAQGFARVSVIPHDAAAFARAIYGEMHRCDDDGADWIIVEAPPDGAEWNGIADRLKRASAS